MCKQQQQIKKTEETHKHVQNYAEHTLTLHGTLEILFYVSLRFETESVAKPPHNFRNMFMYTSQNYKTILLRVDEWANLQTTIAQELSETCCCCFFWPNERLFNAAFLS